MASNFRVLIFSTFFFVLIGCASRFERLQQHDDFDNENLNERNFIVAGLSLGTDTKYSKHTRMILSEDMWLKLNNESKKANSQKLPAHSTSYFISKLGQEKYFKVMREFDEEARVSLKVCQEVQQVFPNINYLLFSRMEQNDNLQNSLALTYYIVDVKTAETVWSATMQNNWQQSQEEMRKQMPAADERIPASIDLTRSKSTKSMIQYSFEKFAQKFYQK